MSGTGLMNQMLGALVGQHESYRDGIVTKDNISETIAAVSGKLGMLDRIAADFSGKEGKPGIGDMLKGMFADELTARELGVLSEYAGMKYDSDKDYWRIKKDGSVEWDDFKKAYSGFNVGYEIYYVD